MELFCSEKNGASWRYRSEPLRPDSVEIIIPGVPVSHRSVSESEMLSS